MLWICCYRSNSTGPSSRSLQFNHFRVNLTTTGKCTKKSASTLLLLHTPMTCTLWGERLKQVLFYVRRSLIHKSKSSHLYFVIGGSCSILSQNQIAVIGIANDNNLKCNSQMSCVPMSAHELKDVVMVTWSHLTIWWFTLSKVFKVVLWSNFYPPIFLVYHTEFHERVTSPFTVFKYLH